MNEKYPALPEPRVKDATPEEIEMRTYDPADVTPGMYPDAENALSDLPTYYESLTPVTEGRWQDHTPTRNVYKYPPHPSTPGKVTDGTSRHLRNQAEASNKGPQWKALAHLRRQRPSKAVRRARAASL
jgi:hypothetical protein